MLGTRFGRGYGPVVIQTMPGMSSTAHFTKLLSEKLRFKSIPEEYIQYKLSLEITLGEEIYQFFP
jgi:hypothetical protein